MTQAEVRAIRARMSPNARRACGRSLIDYHEYAKMRGSPCVIFRGLNYGGVTCPACEGEKYLTPGDQRTWCPLCGALDGKVPARVAEAFMRQRGDHEVGYLNLRSTRHGGFHHPQRADSSESNEVRIGGH